MKKIFFYLYLFGVLLGFIKSNFFSDQLEIRLKSSKSQSYFYLITYKKETGLSGLGLDSCIVYRSVGMKAAYRVQLNQEGELEYKKIQDLLQLPQGQVVWFLKGSPAEEAIGFFEQTAKRYPFIGLEGKWIGPNSNTWNAFYLRSFKTGVQLPSNCPGKDYLGDGFKWLYVPQEKRWIASLAGYVSFQFSDQDFQIGLIGLVLGYNWKENVVYLPGYGPILLGDWIEKMRAVF